MSESKVRALRAIADRFSLPSGSEGHAALRAIYAQVANLTNAAEALHTLRMTRDPTITDGAHQKRVSLAAARLGRETTAAINRIIKISADGHADLAARIREKTKLHPDIYAAEVRATFRTLSNTERMKLLGELVDGNRGPELAALVKAPATITGLPEEYRARFEAAFIARHASEELSEQKALEEAFATSMVSTRTAGEIADTYADPIRLAEIQKAEAKATDAARAFDANVPS